MFCLSYLNTFTHKKTEFTATIATTTSTSADLCRAVRQTNPSSQLFSPVHIQLTPTLDQCHHCDDRSPPPSMSNTPIDRHTQRYTERDTDI